MALRASPAAARLTAAQVRRVTRIFSRTRPPPHSASLGVIRRHRGGGQTRATSSGVDDDGRPDNLSRVDEREKAPPYELRVRGHSSRPGERWGTEEGEALRAHYAIEGWIVVRDVVSPSHVRELQAATDALEMEAAGVVTSVKRKGVFFEVQSASGRKGEPAVEPGVLRKVTSPKKRHAAFARLATHRGILRVARELCHVSRPECVVDQVNMKSPGVGTPFPWHQAGTRAGATVPSLPRKVTDALNSIRTVGRGTDPSE